MMAAENTHTVITLDTLLSDLTTQAIPLEIQLSGLSLDSRKVKKGDLFIALSGTQQHGANFIPAAIEAGAAAIVIEANYTLQLPKLKVPLISIDALSAKIGEIAHRFYHCPSEEINVIGITGTNGKTSTAWFFAQSLHSEKTPVGFIGTLGKGYIDNLEEGVNTTPDAIQVHESLATFRDDGARTVVMEVSSHALEQHRVNGVNFQSVIFTNISRDHLDYHHSMEDYAVAKKRLFTDHQSQYQIINADDTLGRLLIDSGLENVYIYTLNPDHGFPDDRLVFAKIIHTKDSSLELNISSPWGDTNFKTRLMGEFNVYNLLASITALCLTGLSLDQVVQRVTSLESVPGRMEHFSATSKANVVVDYAHTPDAIEKVLQTLVKGCRGRLICVFGCGGDRDQGKRSQMGKVVGQYADHIILTNDNPRTEDPELIINDILSGIRKQASVDVELDRAKAIQLAIETTSSEDIVLIAGKGHENYQQLADQKISFDDREWVKHFLGLGE